MDKEGIVIKFYRIERFLYVHHFRILARMVYYVIYVMFNCVIPPSADLKKNVKIAHGVGIVIHHNAVIGANTKIYQNVTIGGGDGIRVGENCMIGAGAVLLGNIVIGDNVKVGANAVVLHNVEPNSTVVGVPAKNVSVIDNSKIKKN